MEVFWGQLWNDSQAHEYLARIYRHLIVDNIEEDTPRTHDLLAAWLPHFESALVIYDQEAGNRVFLGADPNSAYRLKDDMEEHVTFPESLVTSDAVQTFAQLLSREIYRKPGIEAYQQFVSAYQRRVREVPPEEAYQTSRRAISTVRTALQYQHLRYNP